MRVWLNRLAVLLVGTAAALLIGEVALRLLRPTHSPINFDLFYRTADGQVRLQPNARRQHVTQEWSVAVETNSAGFRDVEAAPRPDQPVVLALGDSLTFGWGVEYDQSFLARLEAALGGPTRGVRVIKAAVPGTGTTDHLALLRTLLPTTRVDAVLVSFYVGNDFNDVAEGGVAQFDVVDGLLVRRGGAQESSWLDGFKYWLKRKSHLAQLVAQQVFLLERRRQAAVPVEQRLHAGLDQRDVWLQQFLQVHLRAPLPPALARGVDRTLAALDEMRRLALDANARFILALIPRNVQVYEIDRQRYQQAFELAEEQWDLDRPQRILRAWADGRDMELIDVLPDLRAAAESSRERLYYFPDSHPTSEGHRVIAEALGRHFAERPVTKSRP